MMATLVSAFRAAGTSLLRKRGGNVAMMFGLSALPIIGVIGLAIDYGGVTSAKSRLDVALDAASLLATTFVSNAVSNGQPNATSQAQDLAIARFEAQAGTVPWVTINSVTANVSNIGGVFTAKIAYQATYQISFGQIFGTPTIPLKNAASSKLAVNPYADISVLLDVSNSMSIGATATDIAKLIALTTNYVPQGPLPGNVNVGEGCAFACHWTNAYTDYYKLAEKRGITLRIDVLRSAVGNLITSMAALNTSSLFRLGLYTFNSAVTEISALSGNISGASANLKKIALDINTCSMNCPESYMDTALAGMTTTVGQSGDGSTQANSRKYLFIITDGLVDEVVGNARVIGPVVSASCNTLKANGVTIMVLYTPYLPLPTNAFYNQYVAPIASNISPSLQNCASSPALFYQASDSASINAALQAMLVNAAKSPGHFIQ